MSKLVLFIAASLDGFIARPDGAIDWLLKYDNKETDFGFSEFYATVDAVIMGRKTYDLCLSFNDWPYKDKPVFVMSNTLKELKNSCNLISGKLGDRINELKTKYKNIWLIGGAELVSQALNEKCLDELIVTLIPDILGSGIRLFENLNEEIKLQHIETRTYLKGLTQIKYRMQTEI